MWKILMHFLLAVWKNPSPPPTNPEIIDQLLIRTDHLRLHRNIIHGSDTLENAKMEVDLWFKAEEFVTYTPCAQSWLYE